MTIAFDAVAPGQSFSLSINKSSSDTLCMLLFLSPTSPSVDMDNISMNSKNEDFNIIPVARSYSNLDWERVAGPYAQDLTVTNCSSALCSIEVPNLPDLDEEGKFILISFSHSLTNEEEVSRFFQQTTFGPTRSMINNWNYSVSLSSEKASWLKEQMDDDQTPMTSHRAYFRQNLDRATHYTGGSQDGSLPSNPFYQPRFPCDKFARWREFSFTSDDYYVPFTVSHAYHGHYLLSINGVPRTVVSANDWKTDYGLSVGVGQYSLCKF